LLELARSLLLKKFSWSCFTLDLNLIDFTDSCAPSKNGRKSSLFGLLCSSLSWSWSDNTFNFSAKHWSGCDQSEWIIRGKKPQLPFNLVLMYYVFSFSTLNNYFCLVALNNLHSQFLFISFTWTICSLIWFMLLFVPLVWVLNTHMKSIQDLLVSCVFSRLVWFLILHHLNLVAFSSHIIDNLFLSGGDRLSGECQRNL
jgi:hypothetical protein